MKGKLKIIVPVAVLLVAVIAYKTVLAKPADSHAKVHGDVYVLPKEFVLNLADGRFAKLTVALVVEPGSAAAAGGHGGGAKPPEGFGTMPQEALVREIVTDTLTEAKSDDLTSRKGRQHLKHEVLAGVKKRTDVKADHVVFTDVAVQ